jgi:hypothetical protein
MTESEDTHKDVKKMKHHLRNLDNKTDQLMKADENVKRELFEKTILILKYFQVRLV